jgi:hypothetical protein
MKIKIAIVDDNKIFPVGEQKGLKNNAYELF